MKAFVTSIGEKTTGICYEQLKRFGFDVILLNEKEEWINKYRKFIAIADEDCIRIDADIIPNENIKQVGKDIGSFGMGTHMTYDLYRNNIGITSPIFYKKFILDILKTKIKDIPAFRPEASASRFKEVNDYKYNSNLIVGLHGFFQDKETVARAEQNKKERKQIEQYDFNLVNKINDLY